MRKVFAQAFRLQTQTGERGLRIVCERCEELFDLRMPFLFSFRVIKKCKSTADERSDQNAAFPHQHLIVPLELVAGFDVRLLDEIQLA